MVVVARTARENGGGGGSEKRFSRYCSKSFQNLLTFVFRLSWIFVRFFAGIRPRRPRTVLVLHHILRQRLVQKANQSDCNWYRRSCKHRAKTR